MPNKQELSAERRAIWNAVFIPLIIVLILVLSFLLEKGMDWDFHTAGIYPRRLDSLWGLFTVIFIHADVSHLANNAISFFILCSFLYYFYRPLATKILLISYLVSSVILWVIGRQSWHIGASGLIYALAFFLFFSGAIRKYVPLIAVSLVVAMLYGSLVWHVFPWKINDSISWEGHLAGGIIGLLLAVYYRNSGPQKPPVIWDEEDDEDEESIECVADDAENMEDNKRDDA